MSQSTSIQDFTIQKTLGRGSFGSVYLVLRKKDQKIYALKTVIFENLNKRDQENSLNEVRILASINHPNVIGYKEAFWDEAGSSLNIVMEYADDGDLESKIVKMRKEGGMFNESLIWSYSIQMIEGLKALHDKKIMHRDIKSANIFLVKDKHQCKIGDMNVSKVIKEKVLRTQTGTPYYASPEVWRDEPYSYKSDLWSIGCVIYELCALRPPFKGKDLDELYGNVCKGNIERISHIYSDELWKMIMMLLQVDVKKRVDCKEFLDSKLIMKKIKEMKENNSECKDLEINKNSFSGTLLKTIKFKDFKDIKAQLPTKKNYDINLNDINNAENYYREINNYENNGDNLINNNNSYLNKNIINNYKKNYFCDNLIEKLTNNINENPNLNKNIINGNNNINNYYYINYSPNYNQCFPTKTNSNNNKINNTNNNIISKKREETKTTENNNYVFKTDFNTKDVNFLEKIDLNMIKNDKKKLIQKNGYIKHYSKNNLNEEKKKKIIGDKMEKELILQKQRQIEKERHIEYNQRLKEEKSAKKNEKSDSKKKLTHRYYNKIKNIKELKLLKKRPASSSRIITLNHQNQRQNDSNLNRIKNKFISKNIFNDSNYYFRDRSKKNNLYIQIYETDRNVKRVETTNNNKERRTKTPLSNNSNNKNANYNCNYNKLKISKRKNKSQVKLNCLSNNSQIGNGININNINKNFNKINSFININYKSTPEEDKEIDFNNNNKPKYDKINKLKKSKNVDKEFWERKNVKIISSNNKNLNKKRKDNIYYSSERPLSVTPIKRNPMLNPNLYENNNINPYILPKNGSKKYDNYNSNKNPYGYKQNKKNNYRYINESENNQISRPITSIGNDSSRINTNYNQINNKSKKKNFIKKDIYDNSNNHRNYHSKNKNNICNKINQQNMRKINALRPSSCKNKGYENNLYFKRKNNSKRYDPDITEPELLMMVNPIKIKENYRNSQKSSLNITLNNNNAENPNNFLNHIKSLNQNNMNLNNHYTNLNNGKAMDNIDWNKIQMNSNCKYNHLKLFKNIYNNDDKINDEPIKVINFFQ